MAFNSLSDGADQTSITTYAAGSFISTDFGIPEIRKEQDMEMINLGESGSYVNYPLSDYETELYRLTFSNHDYSLNNLFRYGLEVVLFVSDKRKNGNWRGGIPEG